MYQKGTRATSALTADRTQESQVRIRCRPAYESSRPKSEGLFKGDTSFDESGSI